MNATAEAYAIVNVEAGHSSRCSFAAGADCTCDKGVQTVYFVTARNGQMELVYHYSFDVENAKDYARAMRAGVTAERNVRLRKLSFHTVWEAEAYEAFLRSADEDMDRIADWASDFEYSF